MITIKVMGLYVPDAGRRLVAVKQYTRGTEAYILVKVSNKFNVFIATDGFGYFKTDVKGDDYYITSTLIPVTDEYKQAIAAAIGTQ
jgi:hypothetical protein